MPFLLGLALGPAVAYGLARFAYALLLPAMRMDLAWTYAQAGAINTANALGYLCGAILAVGVVRRFGGKQSFVGALFFTGLLLVGTSLTRDFSQLLALRFVAGAAAATALVAGGGLAARAGEGGRHRAVLALGIYFGGGGIGIVISALVVPAAVAAGNDNWPLGWVMLGGASLLAALFAWAAARRLPQMPSPAAEQVKRWSWPVLLPTLVAYTLFGVGYIGYMTFIIAFLLDEGFSNATVVLFWIVLGISAVVGAFAWTPILARATGGWGVVAVMAMVTVGAAFQREPNQGRT